MGRELDGAVAVGKHKWGGDHWILAGIHHAGKKAESAKRVIRRADDRDGNCCR